MGTLDLAQQQPSPTDSLAFRFITNKPPKRRSLQACLECRRRKVRCDILAQRPAFCTNCRLDGIKCEVGKYKRRRRHEPTDIITFVQTPDSAGLPAQSSPPWDASVEGQQSASPEADLAGEVPSSQDAVPPPDTDLSSFLKPAPAVTTPPKSLPWFIKPLSPNLCAEDWQYLSAKSCFAFPPVAFQSCILQRFIDYVHPLLPVIDVGETRMVLDGKSGKRMSLLVYHALMGAGLAAVEIEIIKKYGYPTKAAARNAFYTKAKALLEMDAELDRQANCQAALLFISWSSNQDPKDGLHWTGLAITQAYSVALQKSTLPALGGTNEQRLKRRLWWTIVMKESDVCLAMGKPSRISAVDMSMLDHNDFEVELSLDYSELDASTSGRETDFKNTLEAACIAKARLSLIVHKVVRFLHSMDRGKVMAQTHDSRVWQLDAELQDWRHQLPRGLWWLNRSAEPVADKRVQLTVSVLNMTYLMATIMLHKPEVPVKRWAECIAESHDWSMDDHLHMFQAHARAMKRAADDMTSIHKELNERRLTWVIPAIGVATVCAAVSVHLLDARLNQAAVRKKSLAQLDVCLSVLEQVGNLHYTAAEVAKLVESSVLAVKKLPQPAKPIVEEPVTSPRGHGRTPSAMPDPNHGAMAADVPTPATAQSIPPASPLSLPPFPEWDYFLNLETDLELIFG